MASNPPGPPRIPPSSPDELGGGFRGRVAGVTRIGPRAFGLAFIVICGLLIAILYGLNHGSTYGHAPQEAFASQPPAPPSNEPHFGQNEPLVATAAPNTPAPPLLLPPTPVPDLENANAASKPAAPPKESQAESAAQARADAQAQQAEEARLAEEKKRNEEILAALRSPILTGQNAQQGGNGQNAAQNPAQLSFAGNGGGESGGGAPPASGGGSGSNALLGENVSAQAQKNPNEFLDGPTGQYKVAAAGVVLPEGGNPKDFLQAQRFSPISPFEITASSVIPASLITGIDSEIAGVISASVREDVYDTKTGRYLLIPRGSRLVGLYKSDAVYGQTRVLVAWQRLIFPDTTSIDLLNMGASDVQGGAGVAGQVDNHYGKIFGAALLTSILAAGLQLSQPQQATVLGAPSAGQVASQAVAQQIVQTGTQILQKDLSIPPTLHIPHGYPFLVVVDRDIVLPGTYRPQ